MISTIYAFPFKGNHLVEGWQLSTIVQDQSGNPLTILSGSTSTTNINNLTGVATIRPDVIAPIKMIRDVNQWLHEPEPEKVPPAVLGFAVIGEYNRPDVA